MLFGTIESNKVTPEFDFVERGVKVYPIPGLAFDSRREGESVFACMAAPNQIMPPDVATPDGMYALLAVPRAKAIILDEETRNIQSLSTRVTFLHMLLRLFETQTEAFANNGIALTTEPFINPFAMNALFEVIDSVVSDMTKLLGIEVKLPEIKVQIQKAAPTILGADGNPTGQRSQIIC